MTANLDIEGLERAIAALPFAPPFEYHPVEMYVLPSPSAIYGDRDAREGWLCEAASREAGESIAKILNESPALLSLARSAEAMREAKDNAYHERDRLVCALSKLFPAWLERHPESDTAWENDWRWIVFVEIPSWHPQSSCADDRMQVSWHIHDSELAWFAHLERRAGPSWDGHSTEEKYRRLGAIRASSGKPARSAEDWKRRAEEAERNLAEAERIAQRYSGQPCLDKIRALRAAALRPPVAGETKE